MNELFHRFAHSTADKVGSPAVFLAGLIVVLIWAVSGPIFHYSDTWQLVINTGTTIITFLMVFLIQNTQNRDARAMHLKLDELIRVSNARNMMVGLESCSDDELAEIAEEFAKIREKVLARSKNKVEEKTAAQSER
jgi:low affinity Fe/Cu permease